MSTNFLNLDTAGLAELHKQASECLTAFNGGPESLSTLFNSGLLRHLSLAEIYGHLGKVEMLPGLRAVETALPEDSPELVVCKSLKLLLMVGDRSDRLEGLSDAERYEVLEAASFLFLNTGRCFNPAYRLLDNRPDPIAHQVQAISAKFMMSWFTIGVKEYASDIKLERHSRLIVNTGRYPFFKYEEGEEVDQKRYTDYLMETNRYFTPKLLTKMLTANLIDVSRYQVMGFPYRPKKSKAGTILLQVRDGKLVMPTGFPESLERQKAFFEDDNYQFSVVTSLLSNGYFQTGETSRKKATERIIEEIRSKLEGVLHPMVIEKRRGELYWFLFDPDKNETVKGVPYRFFVPVNEAM